jgi:outer membrane protein
MKTKRGMMEKGGIVFLCFAVMAGTLLGIQAKAFGQTALKFGYIDMEQAVNDSKAGKEARKKFIAFMKQKKIEGDKKKRELDSMRQILQKQGALLAEDVRVQKEREYQKKLGEFQLYVKNSRADLRTKEMEMSKKIIRQLMKIVFNFAKKQGYTMIFEKTKSGLLYAPDSLNLTPMIIKVFNQEAAKGKK